MSNVINSVMVNGINIDTNCFVVEMKEYEEFQRCLVASSEFLRNIGVEYSTYDGLMLADCENISINGNIYYNNDKKVIVINDNDGICHIVFDFVRNRCFVRLDYEKEDSSIGGFFVTQPGTAFGRFLGQGLIFCNDECVAASVDELNDNEAIMIDTFFSGFKIQRRGEKNNYLNDYDEVEV